MDDWRAYLRAGLRLPPHIAARKALALGVRLVRQREERRRAYRTPAYAPGPPSGDLRLRLRGWSFRLGEDQREPALYAAAQYCRHRFDLLGSGWVEVRHGMACEGLEGIVFPPGPAVAADAEGAWLEGRINPPDLAESRRIWRLVRDPYVPIDWQLDIRSGFRWSERAFFRDVAYGRERGADVKQPWELARLQHLPQLAVLYAAEPAEVPPETSAGWAAEFRNQVLDFLATNPPGFGVNWTCAMDVGIRIVNILVAFDIFLQAGADFDTSFSDILKRSTYEHGRHIVENLEWAEQGRGNHYLSDIVGLLFCAAYLPASDETDAWLQFAIKELVTEAGLQFLPDGGNIEASTAYHRLSGEILVFGAALVLGLESAELDAIAQPLPPLSVRPPQSAGMVLHEVAGLRTPLPAGVFRTLSKAAELTRDATKPSGDVVQWGDNDSGRLMKLTPAWRQDEGRDRAASWRENALDHRAFVAASAALTGRTDLAVWAGSWAEAAAVQALADRRVVKVDPDAAACSTRAERQPDAGPPSGSVREIAVPLPSGAAQNMRRAAYPAFGHFAFISPRLFVAIRCADWTERRPPGHAHDDGLAVELQIDGREVFVDPGTFVYTPLPEERNRYRAAAAHFVPRPDGARGANLSLGLFAIEDLPSARCLTFNDRIFIGEASGPGWRVSRTVTIETDCVLIRDVADERALADLPAASLPPVCLGYGRKTARSPRPV